MVLSSIKVLLTVMIVMTSAMLRNPNAAFGRIHVHIYNFLDLGPTLTVHCWSKNDDLGEQELPPKDSWEFSFKLDFFGRTRFDCTFKWNDEVHRFPIYVQMRDNWACLNCTWVIYQAGPCRQNTGSNDVCYHWHDKEETIS
ncbi:hypothetical protein MLD38_030828 [Melastoma candidum]|uniref:Uncharacterized protein n=1 Tax=Melastoma candidum TaxID=119954 RepID=A0ACB9MND2_9MYRT|nr:hypothetical protein MLD38_030828 [Melastoma candidum]